MVRVLATGLAVNRVLFGIAFLAVPGPAAKGWIGKPAGTAGGQVMIRATGARDLALGALALRALRSKEDERPWFAAQAMADGADAMATWLARDRLGGLRTAYALSMAAGSAAIAGAYVASRTREPAAAGQGAETRA
jgi:hypothetical protein